MEFVDEAQIFKCCKHPSRRRKSGICPKCLRDRLVTLCPNCAVALPCPSCPPPLESSSSSSSSSSFSLFSFSRGGSRRDFTTSSSQNGSSSSSNPLESDPVLRKSRSVAIPFLRSKSRYVGNQGNEHQHSVAINEQQKVNNNCTEYHINEVPQKVNNNCTESHISEVPQKVNNNCTESHISEVPQKVNNNCIESHISEVPQKVHKSAKISFRSMFMLHKTKKPDTQKEIEKKVVKNVDTTKGVDNNNNNNNNSMMMRTKSVAVGSGNNFGPTSSKNEDMIPASDNPPMMMRTQSVAVGGGRGLVPGSSKPKGWYFTSPIKSFRHPKPLNSVAVA